MPKMRGITPIRRAILEALCDGLSTPEVGKRVFLSERMVKQHLFEMRSEFGANNRVHLVAMLMRSGKLG